MAPRDSTSRRRPAAGPNDRFNRPVFRRVRKACLALAEVTETVSWDHPNFRAGKGTFCAFEVVGGRPSIAFRLPPTDGALVNARGTFATPYGRGRWTSVWVDDDVDQSAVAGLVERSYRGVASKRLLRRLEETTNAERLRTGSRDGNL